MKFNQRLNERYDYKFEFYGLDEKETAKLEKKLSNSNEIILLQLVLMHKHVQDIDYNFEQQIHIDHFEQRLKSMEYGFD